MDYCRNFVCFGLISHRPPECIVGCVGIYVWRYLQIAHNVKYISTQHGNSSAILIDTIRSTNVIRGYQENPKRKHVQPCCRTVFASGLVRVGARVYTCMAWSSCWTSLESYCSDARWLNLVRVSPTYLSLNRTLMYLRCAWWNNHVVEMSGCQWYVPLIINLYKHKTVYRHRVLEANI